MWTAVVIGVTLALIAQKFARMDLRRLDGRWAHRNVYRTLRWTLHRKRLGQRSLFCYNIGAMSTALALVALVALQSEPLLLVGGILVDGSGSPPVEDAWVLVENGRVQSLGTGTVNAPTAPPATRVDVTGKTILPGLADMHVHLGELESARWIMKLLLAHGVTTIHETGNRLGNLTAIRRFMESDATPFPHLYTSGYILDGDYDAQRFRQPGSETRRDVEEEVAFGVDFVKTYNWTSSGALEQIAELASEHGVMVTGHTPLSWSSIGSIDAGIYILQHLRLRPYEVLDDFELVARYPVDGALMRRTGFWAHVSAGSAALRKTLDAWEKRKDRFFVTPTLVVQEATAEGYDYPAPKFTNDPKLRWLSPRALDEWKESSPPTHYGDLSPAEIEEAKRSFHGMALFIRAAHQRGIRILAGTDTPIPWLVPGASLHRELLHFVELAGMTPSEAIHTSTGRAAKALRVPDRGLIRRGYVADLVIVDGNAAMDIRALEAVETVILGGRAYGRDELLDEVRRWAVEDRPR